MKLNVKESSAAGFEGLDTAGALMVAGKGGREIVNTPDGMEEHILFEKIEGTPNWSLGLAVPSSQYNGIANAVMLTIILSILVILAIPEDWCF